LVAQIALAMRKNTFAVKNRKETLVLVPARNESPTIARVIAGIHQALPGVPVVVVDDGSKDDTGRLSREAGAIVLRHTFGMGYGAALHTGYLYAREQGFTRVVQIDADGQHEPLDLPSLLAPIEAGEADLVVGSRFLNGAPLRPRLSPLKHLGIRFFSFLASLGLRRRLTDPTSGFQALGAAALELLCHEDFPDDYPDADVLLYLARRGCRIEERGVRMYSRQAGRSMHSGVRSVYYVLKMSLSMALTPLRAKEKSAG